MAVRDMDTGGLCVSVAHQGGSERPLRLGNCTSEQAAWLTESQRGGREGGGAVRFCSV